VNFFYRLDALLYATNSVRALKETGSTDRGLIFMCHQTTDGRAAADFNADV